MSKHICRRTIERGYSNVFETMKGTAITPGRQRYRHAAAKLATAAGLCFCVASEAMPADGADLDRGKKLYDFYCYQCHGYAGDANTVAAAYLDPQPRNFTKSDPRRLTRDSMLVAVREGRPGTAMTSFSRVLGIEDINAVIDYIRTTLMKSPSEGLAYHTAANGWPDHRRYQPAFVFAQGDFAIDTPSDHLTPQQQFGKSLFMSACITCHEPRRANEDPLRFEPRAVSYPRSKDTCVDCHAARPPELLPISTAQTKHLIGNEVQGVPSREIGASPYLIHGDPVTEWTLSPSESRGKRLFLANCAFCHAADGSGRNWIGSFLEPRPRELRSAHFWLGMRSRTELINVIRNGVSRSSMPAWKDVLSDAQISDIVEYLLRAPYHLEGDTANVTTAAQTARQPRLHWRKRALKKEPLEPDG